MELRLICSLIFGADLIFDDCKLVKSGCIKETNRNSRSPLMPIAQRLGKGYLLGVIRTSGYPVMDNVDEFWYFNISHHFFFCLHHFVVEWPMMHDECTIESVSLIR